MMEPTPEYLTAPEVGRTREEASHGATRVIVENFSDDAHVFGKSMIYLSVDNGETFALLDWQTSWLSWWKVLGRQWPPHHVHIERLDDHELRLTYFEANDDSPPSYAASYVFADQRWRLR